MKKNIDNIFIRFGKLHLTKQDGFGNDTFHSPPASKGFYAFPIRFQEYYLVGSIEKTQPTQYNLPKKLKHENILKVEDKEIREKLWVENRKFWKIKLKELRHEFFVDNDKLIWHHLDAKPFDIIDRHNSWIKTTVGVFKKSLIKESLKLRVESSGDLGINSVNKTNGFFCEDHFEVFFDTKVV